MNRKKGLVFTLVLVSVFGMYRYLVQSRKNAYASDRKQGMHVVPPAKKIASKDDAINQILLADFNKRADKVLEDLKIAVEALEKQSGHTSEKSQ